MRLVVDTNVLVSGLLNPFGAPGRTLDLLLAGDFLLLADDRMLAEYSDVLARPRFGFASRQRADFLDYLRDTAEPIQAGPLALTLPDPDDLPFLEVAVAGRADRLVTGIPRHFVPVAGKHRVRVVTPREFMESVT